MSIVLYPTRPNRSWPEDTSTTISAIREAAGSVELVTPANLEEAMKAAPQAEGWIGHLTPQLLAAAPQLRWLQSPTISLESVVFPELIASNVVVTKQEHLADAEVSTHALMLLLALARDVPHLMRQQKAHEWKREAKIRDIAKMTVLLLGLGAIGKEFVKRVRPLGPNLIAVDPKVTQAPEGVSQVAHPDRIPDLIPQADAVVCIAPLTPQTMGLFDDAMFKRFKKDALFVNVGRGQIVKTDSLAKALKEGWIGAAAIDVADPEPLPADSPLWDIPNLMITPHLATLGSPVPDRIRAGIVENVKRFVSGQPFTSIADKANWY